MTGTSVYAPQTGCKSPEPAWKSLDDFKDYVHPRQPSLKGTVATLLAKGGLRTRT